MQTNVKRKFLRGRNTQFFHFSQILGPRVVEVQNLRVLKGVERFEALGFISFPAQKKHPLRVLVLERFWVKLMDF